MKLFSTLLLLIIAEGIFNTDVYSLNNSFGKFIDLLLNITIFGFGFFCFFKISNENFAKVNYMIFIVISFLSMAMNQSNFIDFFEFILRYGKIYLIFFIGYNISHRFHIEQFFRIITLINMINFITNTLWYYNIQIIPNKYLGTLDFATGIMSDALYQSFFSIIVLSFSLLYALKTSKYSKGLFLLNIISAIIQIYWSYSYHFYVVIFISFAASLILLQSFINSLKVIIPIIITALLISSLSTSEFFTNSITTLANTSPKIASYNDTFSGEYQKSYQKIIGVGPGNGGSYIGIENKSLVAENYFSIYDYFTDKLRRGSITTLPNTGITTLKSELGYLGLLNFILFLFFLIHRLKNKLFKSKNDILINLCIFLIIIFITENLFADYLQHSIFPILIFLLAGIAYGKK